MYKANTLFICSVVLLIIGIPIFFGVFFGLYEKLTDNNSKYHEETCQVLNTTVIPYDCYIKYGCSCDGCNAPATCSGRIQLKTSGTCCDGDCCSYEYNNQCKVYSTSQCSISWSTCYNVQSEYIVVSVAEKYNFTDIDGSCQANDLDCVRQLVSKYAVGAQHTCWISYLDNNLNSIQATSHNPYKNTDPALAGSIIGGILMFAGFIFLLLGIYIHYKRYNTYEEF